MQLEKVIMVVDDSLTVRKMLRGILEPQGFKVIEAESGETGLELAATNSLDMFIIDVNMDGINGLEMLRQLRELPNYADTPAFVLTTESSAEQVKVGKEVGATAWIVKPVSANILIKGIRRVLGG